jgi:site-specific DNA recombinase
VTREAIADGYDSCTVTSVPAADVEGAVLDHVQKLLAAPELVARTWAAVKREGGDDITECEVTCLLADFATVWAELFPAEQARIVQLLVERVDVHEAAVAVRIRAEGLASLVGELRQQGERKAAWSRGPRQGSTALRSSCAFRCAFSAEAAASASLRPTAAPSCTAPSRSPVAR